MFYISEEMLHWFYVWSFIKKKTNLKIQEVTFPNCDLEKLNKQ